MLTLNVISATKMSHFVYPLQATWVQLRSLFCLQDDVKSLLEDCLNAPLDQQTTLATATEFLCKYISFKNGHKFIHKHRLHTDSFPKPTKATGDFHCAKEMLPIEIKFVCDGGRKAAIEGNLAQIVTFLSEKYSKREFAVDAYLVLTETYSFLLGMRSHLLDHFGVTKARPNQKRGEEGPSWPCDVCGDDCYAEYCGSNVCGKCRHFFVAMMRSRRTVATLKCSYYKNDGLGGVRVEERELCTNDFGQVDVACDACRFWKCFKVGMVDEYYATETQRPSASSCAICRHRSLDVEFLLGTYVCGDCLESFKNGIVARKYTGYECACLATDARREPDKCGKCFFDRLKQFGFLELYYLKAQDGFQGASDPESPSKCSVNLDIVFRNPEQCCACDNRAIDGGGVGDGLFLGARACQVCRAFLVLSIGEEIYASYCCPAGELGRLCSLDATSEMERCKFCWLRRLEIEGLVDRWFMCKGNPDAWNEAEMEDEEYQERDEVQAVESGRDDDDDGNQNGEVVVTENVGKESEGAEAVENGEEDNDREAEVVHERDKGEARNDVKQNEVDAIDNEPNSPKRRRVSSRSRPSKSPWSVSK